MRYVALLISMLLLVGCAAPLPAEDDAPPSTPSQAVPETSDVVQTVPTEPTPTEAPDPVRQLLNQMTLEERVGQLFFARCQPDTALTDIQTYHLGGFVLFASDFEGQTPDSFREKVEGYQSAASIPLLLGVDEEGGTVTRISRYSAFRSSPFPSPRTSFAQGGMEQVLAVETEKYQLLRSLGINVNLGPVCDISQDSEAFMYARSLGQDAQTTASFVSQTVDIMNQYQIGSVLKHFPGYGNNTDTHTGIAVDTRSLEALESQDLVPFAAGINADCSAILVSHTIVQALDDTLPASLSPAVHQYLRQEMGFEGVILTDDLVMQAITDQYGAGEAAVMAVLAGNDLLCSTDYALQYQAVYDAVMAGRIDLDTLNAAAGRVLRWKINLGLLDVQE